MKDRERRVRFHGRVQFKTIRHVADFTDEEVQAGWYRKKDFVRMSEEVSDIAQLVAQGHESYDGEELSIRGLEHLVEEDVADYRAEKMIASIDAVLDEQDEQRDEDVEEPEVIAKIYSEIVAPLQREAYLVGLRDAKDGAEAAEQMPDLQSVDQAPPQKHTPCNNRGKPSTAGSLHTVSSADSAVSTEGEEVLQFNDTDDDEKKKKEDNKEHLTAKEKKEQRKQKRAMGFNGSERSPIIRRRDGTFAFRNDEAEEAKAVESKQRKDSVRASLFKFMGEEDEEEIPLDAFMKPSKSKGKGRR